MIQYLLPNGMRLTADVAGPIDCVPVLLLHGGGQTRGAWRESVDLLAARGYRAIALDLRGHGDSEWSPDGQYGLEIVAADIRQVLHELGQPAIVIGASFGGLVSMILLGGETPPPLLGLVLVDITQQLDDDGTRRVFEFMRGCIGGFATMEDAAEAISRYQPHRPRPDNLDGLRRNLRQCEDGRYHWHWDPRFLDNHETEERLNNNARLSAALGTIRAPILLVHGSDSDVVTADEIASFSRLLPDAEIVAIAGARHMVSGDNNDAFANAILNFIDRVVTGLDRR